MPDYISDTSKFPEGPLPAGVLKYSHVSSIRSNSILLPVSQKAQRRNCSPV